MKTIPQAKVVVLIAGAYVVAMVGCAAPQRMGQVAPEITLDNLQGQSVSLSQYKGNVVLLGFWAVG